MREYLVDLAPAKAARRAGLTPAKGAIILREPEVAAAVEQALSERERRLELTADKVLDQIGLLAFSDLRRVFREDGSLLPPGEWPADVAPAIS